MGAASSITPPQPHRPDTSLHHDQQRVMVISAPPRCMPRGNSCRHGKVAVQAAKRWRVAWIEFVKSVEVAAAGGAAWAQLESPNTSTERTFLTTSHLTTELPILSRTFLSALSQLTTTLLLPTTPPPTSAAVTTLLTASSALWTRVRRVFDDTTRLFDGLEWDVGKTRRDGGGQDVVKRKIAALKRVARGFERAGREWGGVCREEERCVAALRDRWRHREEDDTPAPHALPHTTTLLTTLFTTWHAQLTSPTTHHTRRSLTDALSALSQTAHQLHDREVATLEFLSAVKDAGKKARKTCGGRNLSWRARVMMRGGDAARICPDPDAITTTTTTANNNQEEDADDSAASLLLTHNRGLSLPKHRKLSRKLHALSTARHRLHINTHDNAEFAWHHFTPAHHTVWATATRVAEVWAEVYAGLSAGEEKIGWGQPVPAPPIQKRREVGEREVRRASGWKRAGDEESMVVVNPLGPMGGQSIHLIHSQPPHAQPLLPPTPIPTQETIPTLLRYPSPTPEHPSQIPSAPAHLPAAGPEPTAPSPFHHPHHVLPPTAPPEHHLASTSLHHLPIKDVRTAAMPAEKRRCPPPTPFVPGYDPTAASGMRALQPTPPPIPPRPAHVRKRTLRPLTPSSAIVDREIHNMAIETQYPPPVPQRKKPTTTTTSKARERKEDKTRALVSVH
ncbi:hypothetical protein DFJ77DRAFT_461475 [Powellomyces hirtus]|nr:hypothetical protein DFJ77DRAFT_461475 [Powellomyces hirtus]